MWISVYNQEGIFKNQVTLIFKRKNNIHIILCAHGLSVLTFIELMDNQWRPLFDFGNKPFSSIDACTNWKNKTKQNYLIERHFH